MIEAKHTVVINGRRKDGAYKDMIARCANPKHKFYANYGGRGITVCDRWLGKDGFKNYVMDTGPRPSPQHTIDRKDNDKGYSPENCRWATKQQQGVNRRTPNMTKYGYRGIFKSDNGIKERYWRAAIKVNGKTIHLGTYIDIKDAAKAWDKAAVKHFGEDAPLNFPQLALL